MDTQDNKDLEDSQQPAQEDSQQPAQAVAQQPAQAAAQQPAQAAAQQPAQAAAQQPAQAAYQQPAQAAYQQPAQAAYQQPAQAAYQQPVYQQPAQAAYQQPAQAAYQQPAQAAYQQPVYQQPAYQQPVYQQPVYQQPVYQQPVYQQPVAQVSRMAVASEAEKSAYFLSGSSIYMLIFAIVGTINLFVSLISDVMSLSIGGFLGEVLTLLMVIGYWIVFVNSKKKKLSTTGISLIRIPYIIAFIFSVFSFIGTLILYTISLNAIGILVQLLVFIFECICFNSVNKSLKMARDINLNQSVSGRKAGSFAAVIMIISGVLTLIGDIVSSLMWSVLSEALESFLGEDNVLSGLLSTGGTISIVVAVVVFITSISAALVLLKFGGLIKKAHGEA